MLLFMLALMLFPQDIAIDTGDSEMEMNSELRNLWEQHEPGDYTQSAPLDIQNNTAFTYYGFTGNGSAAEPYIMQNLNITSSTTPISIQDTDAYFIIYGCWLLKLGSTGNAVRFENVTNGVVDSSIVIASTDTYAIDFQQCNSSEITGNAVMGAYGGIHLFVCQDIMLSNNTVEFTTFGVSVFESWECVIDTHLLRDCDKGIRVFFSQNISMDHNQLLDNLWGAYLQDSTGCHVSDNTVVGNNVVGIELRGSATCFVYVNNVTANSGGGSGEVEA
jgi:parallel beta-helix repeat protein